MVRKAVLAVTWGLWLASNGSFSLEAFGGRMPSAARTLMETVEWISASSGPHRAGRYAITWDGTDEEGYATGSGVVVAQLVGKRIRPARKMVLIRWRVVG